LRHAIRRVIRKKPAPRFGSGAGTGAHRALPGHLVPEGAAARPRRL